MFTHAEITRTLVEWIAPLLAIALCRTWPRLTEDADEEKQQTFQLVATMGANGISSEVWGRLLVPFHLCNLYQSRSPEEVLHWVVMGILQRRCRLTWSEAGHVNGMDMLL